MESTGGEGQKCEGLSFDSNVPPDPEAAEELIDAAEAHSSPPNPGSTIAPAALAPRIPWTRLHLTVQCVARSRSRRFK